jgi:hypothetical protein
VQTTALMAIAPGKEGRKRRKEKKEEKKGKGMKE